MQRLEVSGAVRPVQSSLGVKGLIVDKDIPFINNYTQTQTLFNSWRKLSICKRAPKIAKRNC